MEVRIERLPAETVAVRRHEGPYEGLAVVVGSLVQTLREQKGIGGAVTTIFVDEKGLEAGVPDAEAVPTMNGDGGQHGADGEAIHAHVWIPAKGLETDDGDAARELRLEEIPSVEAACVMHTGDPLRLPHIALALRRFLEQKNYAITEETRIVHLMPDWENPDDWIAEVRVPLQRLDK